jgi:hypothetical protein
VQEHDGIALSNLYVRHLPAEDVPPLFLVRKYRRDHVRLSCERDEFRRTFAVTGFTQACAKLQQRDPQNPPATWRRQIRLSAFRAASSQLAAAPLMSLMKFPSPHGFARAEDSVGYEKNITFLIENCAAR